MGRILFWLLLALVAYLGYRWWRVKRASLQRSASEPAQVEAMVRCAACGLNLPQSEALATDGQWFCSEEHRRRGATAPDSEG